MNKENSLQHWDKVYSQELNYREWRQNPKTYQHILHDIDQHKYDLVCEVGCGYSPLLHVTDITVIGVDISSVLITELQKRHPQHVFMQGDVTTLYDLPKHDCVVAVNVLEHMTNDELLHFFTLVTKSKKCYFAVPHDILPPSEEPEHHQSFTYRRFETVLKTYFTDVEIYEIFDTWEYNGEKYALPMLLAECSDK